MTGGNVIKENLEMPAQSKLTFDGETYDPKLDQIRLGKQAHAVFAVMKRGGWRTLAQISHELGGVPEASISARLRDFRKDRFGRHHVERRRNESGLWFYRLIVNPDVEVEQ